MKSKIENNVEIQEVLRECMDALAWYVTNREKDGGIKYVPVERVRANQDLIRRLLGLST